MALIKTKVDIPIIEGISTETNPDLQRPNDLLDVQDFDWAADGSMAKRAGFAVDATDSRGGAVSNPLCLMSSEGRTLAIASGPATPTGADLYSTAPYVYEYQRSEVSGGGSRWQKKEIAGLAMLDEGQVYSVVNSDVLNLDSAVIGRLQCIIVDKAAWSSTYVLGTGRPYSGAIPTASTGLEARIIDQDTQAVVATFSFDTATTSTSSWSPRVIATENKFVIFWVNNTIIQFATWDAGSSPSSNSWSSYVLEGSPTVTNLSGDIVGPEVFDVLVDNTTGYIYTVHVTAATTGYKLSCYTNVAALSTGPATTNSPVFGFANIHWVSLGMTLNNIVVACHVSALGNIYSAQYTKGTVATAVANRVVTTSPSLETLSLAVDSSNTTSTLIAFSYFAGGGVLTGDYFTAFFTDSEAGTVGTRSYYLDGVIGSNFSGCMSNVNSSFPQITYIAIQKNYHDIGGTIGGVAVDSTMDFQPRYTIHELGYSPSLTPPYVMKPIGVVKDGTGKRFFQCCGPTGGGVPNIWGSFPRSRSRLPSWTWCTTGTTAATTSPSYLEADLQPSSVYGRHAVIALPGNPSLTLHQSDISVVTVSPIHSALGRCAQSAEAVLINGGGVTSSCDSLPEAGFFAFPAIKGNTGFPVAVVTPPPNGVYKTVVVFSWRDEKGNLFRSQPSLPASYTYAGAGTINNIEVLANTMASRRGIDVFRNFAGASYYSPTIEVYQTDVGGTVYFLSQQAAYTNIALGIGPLFPAVPPWKSAWTGATYDPQGETLYTTGGILDNGIVPNALDVESFNQRAFVLAPENKIRFSKLLQPNKGAEFPDEFTIQLSYKGGKAYAIRAISDRLIIFKRNQIEILSGTGPADDGSGQQYSEPDILTEGIGCINPRAVVSYPDGIIFEGTKGFWLIGQNLGLTPIGSKIRAFTESGYFPGTYCGGIHLPERQEVHFSSMLTARGVVRWNYRKQRWSRMTANSWSVSSMGILGNKVKLCIPPVDMSGTITTGPSLMTERISGLSTIYQDVISGSGILVDFSPKMTTGWIKMEGELACERCYALLIRTKLCINGNTWPSGNQAAIKIDFTYKSASGSTGGDLATNSITFKLNADGIAGKEVIRVPLPKQKFEALQVDISFQNPNGQDIDGIGTIVGLAAELGVRPGQGAKFGIARSSNTARTN